MLLKHIGKIKRSRQLEQYSKCILLRMIPKDKAWKASKQKQLPSCIILNCISDIIRKGYWKRPRNKDGQMFTKSFNSTPHQNDCHTQGFPHLQQSKVDLDKGKADNLYDATYTSLRSLD
jgi:hypothetical protein